MEFLRATLRLYKNATRRGQKWTDRDLADAILDCPGLPPAVRFDQETLRRFLKGDRQNHGADFLRATAAFLLHEKWITAAALAMHDKDIELRTAVALQSFLLPAASGKTAQFLAELDGFYIRYALAAERIIKTVLTVSSVADASVLRVTQREHQYRTSASEYIMEQAITPSLDTGTSIERRLLSHATEHGSPQFAFGFGVAGTGAVAFMVRDERRSAATVYLADILAYGAYEDAVQRISAIRYSGWNADQPSASRFDMVRLPDASEWALLAMSHSRLQ
jgi:hypothetical protein